MFGEIFVITPGHLDFSRENFREVPVCGQLVVFRILVFWTACELFLLVSRRDLARLRSFLRV